MTEEYRIWKTCQQLGILPPGVKASWDENTNWIKAKMLAFMILSQE